MLQGFQIYQGGRAGAAGAQAYALGATHHSVVSSVTESDVTNELAHRGYNIYVAPAPVHHTPVSTPTLTKTMAISVAIDEALTGFSLPRTSSHPYRCPTGSGCAITQGQWTSMVGWCVTVSNGYLSGQYSLPTWAKSALAHGSLSGMARGRMGLAGLGSVQDWMQQNSWLVESVGDILSRYGESLTAQNVKDAIKASTEGQFTKDDAMKLLAALSEQGKLPAGKSGTVAAGANAAASPSWMMPAMIGGAALLVVLLMKK